VGGGAILFVSPTFLFVFLPACVAVYFAARGMRLRNAVLLGASWLFYAWGEPLFVALMLGVTAFNYAAAIQIEEHVGRARKAALASAVAVNLTSLGVFKYAGFVALSANTALAPFHLSVPVPHVALPLGVSFFTFHALSYIIDVYRGRFAANRRFREVALYIALFPQLIAGPIVRYKTIARRLAHRRHSLGRASAGLRIFVIGLAQKLLIADPMAPVANAVFDHAHHPALARPGSAGRLHPADLFRLRGLFDDGRGLGLVFGFSLPANFRRPYASASITEFWRRWHISLSTWFRDVSSTSRSAATRAALDGVAQPDPGLPALRSLAWRELDLRPLGRMARRLPGLERLGLGAALRRAPRPVGWAYALLTVMFGWVLFRGSHLANTFDIWAGMTGLHPRAALSHATARRSRRRSPG
jgi:D-alanyl-lipoteichoic acid acyltransferase DltB (MBOAT superfamily)